LRRALRPWDRPRERRIVSAEAVHMLNMVPTAPSMLPIWLVQLEVDLAAGGRPELGDDGVEPMVELLRRTEGVRSVAVGPLDRGRAVGLGLDATDATAALERARGLTVACARYAGLGRVAVRRARVTPAPDAGRA